MKDILKSLPLFLKGIRWIPYDHNGTKISFWKDTWLWIFLCLVSFMVLGPFLIATLKWVMWNSSKWDIQVLSHVLKLHGCALHYSISSNSDDVLAWS